MVARGTIAPPPFAVAPSADGTGFVAAWARIAPDERDLSLVLRQWSASAEPVGEELMLIPLDRRLDLLQIFPSIRGYVVFYRTRFSSQLHAAAFDAAGAILSMEQTSGRQLSRAARTPTGFAVSYMSTSVTGTPHVYVELRDPAGRPTGTPSMVEPSADAQANPWIVWTGDVLAVVWRAVHPMGGQSLRGRELDAAGTPARPSFLVAPPMSAAVAPAGLLPDGRGGVIAAWTRAQAGSSVPVAAGLMRMDLAGRASWLEPARIPPNRRESQDYAMALASDAGSVAVSWQSDRRLALPQILLEAYALDSGLSAAPREELSGGDATHCCPVMASSDVGVATVFYGEADGRAGPFLRVAAR